MTEEIKRRIEQVKNGETPDGYQKVKASLFPNVWHFQPLNKVLQENKEQNSNNFYTKEKVLSVSGNFGVVNQIELLGRSYAGVSVSNYHIVNIGDLVYTKSPLKENPYGIIKLNSGDAGIVSTLYAVYYCINNITGQYLNYYFQIDKYLNNYLRPLVKKGAKNDMKVNNNDVLKGMIAFPPLHEQEKIVEILSHFDKVIEMKKQLITEECKQKKWLLNKFFNQAKSSTQTLGSMCRLTMGQSPDSKSYNTLQKGIPLIQGNADIEKRISKPKNYTTEPTKICEVSDIILSVRAPVGMVAKSKMRACIGRGVCAITPKVNGEYIYQFLLYFEDKWAKVSQGSTFDSVNGDEIKKIAVPLSDNMQYVSNILSTADAKIELLERELDQWLQMKNSLMQLLLTGIVRVNV